MSEYTEILRKVYTLRLRKYLNELPDFCDEFFRGIQSRTTIRTRINYAYDLELFFGFITSLESECSLAGKDKERLTIEDFKAITVDDLEEFIDYLSFYTKQYTKYPDDIEVNYYLEHQNAESAKARKICTINAIFSYFIKKRKIEVNPASFVERPKIRKKNITRLEADEVARLLDEVESGGELNQWQKNYHEKTKVRDLAIITLMLGTGMRLSECIGIDISHIDFQLMGVKVTRKGGNESILYFGDEVMDALELYLEERRLITPLAGHENALFLSLQKRRITDRAVQNLVKKYARLITGAKNISPHKLRSTFGTTLYRETGDIYLVAEVLGHADVNTTKKHYAAIDEEHKLKATKYIKLRGE
ncbi:integrase [Clostridia bacterium]|nr:integrase [Clostridia bacterium]